MVSFIWDTMLLLVIPEAEECVIAPFAVDMDTTLNDGSIYYRQTTQRRILARATLDVRSNFPGSHKFAAKWVFIATYDKVTFAGGDEKSPVSGPVYGLRFSVDVSENDSVSAKHAGNNVTYNGPCSSVFLSASFLLLLLLLCLNHSFTLLRIVDSLLLSHHRHHRSTPPQQHHEHVLALLCLILPVSLLGYNMFTDITDPQPCSYYACILPRCTEQRYT